jgi:acyl transferase domain-containing protein
VRRAGINSFGVGGINVHVVVDQSHESPAPAFSPAPGALKATASSNGAPREPLVIVGVSCLLPAAENIESLRQLLYSRADATQVVPPARRVAACDGTPSPDDCRRGGFLIR